MTNAILHGGPPILLAVECDGGGLHVRVRDVSSTEPVLADRGDRAESGGGITLVELLSSTWGVEPVEDDHGTGKETWFELRRGA